MTLLKVYTCAGLYDAGSGSRATQQDGDEIMRKANEVEADLILVRLPEDRVCRSATNLIGFPQRLLFKNDISAVRG